ncbi:MAG: methyltransferase domain-containing protein [Patescibacteria group bacterium]
MLDTNFWKKYFQVYDVLNLVIPYQELLKVICDELDIRPGDKILEAGSGTGNLVMEIKKNGASVTGLDSSEEGIKIHKSKDLDANVVQGDLTQKLPFPDNYFDKICSNNTIYTLTQGQQINVVGEFYRILKPGGKIIVSNIKKSYSPIKIYLSHIKTNNQRHGLVKTIIFILKMAVPTIKMFYYNGKIKRAGEMNKYHFLSGEEQKELMKHSGFKNISETKQVFAQQAILNSAYKL